MESELTHQRYLELQCELVWHEIKNQLQKLVLLHGATYDAGKEGMERYEATQEWVSKFINDTEDNVRAEL